MGAGAKHQQMINVTKLNHTPIVLNADLIENIEVTPDTVITLTSGRKIMVLESPEEIIRRTIQFRRRLYWAGPQQDEISSMPSMQPEESHGE